MVSGQVILIGAVAMVLIWGVDKTVHGVKLGIKETICLARTHHKCPVKK
jgi:hypothetical protein